MMRFATFAALSLTTLTALPAQAQSRAEVYRAAGTEPFWALTIDGRRIRYEPAEGRVVTVAKPRPIIGFNGERYVAQGLTVDITHVECSDGMSDRRYPDTVTVTLGRRTFRGCGGAPLSEHPGQGMPLLDGDWAIRSIGGRPAVPGTSPRVTFRGPPVSGSTGCNSFRGNYRFERGRLMTGPLATTKRGCIPQVNQQEQRLLDLLGQRLTVSRNRNGRLVLTARDERTLVLARSR